MSTKPKNQQKSFPVEEHDSAAWADIEQTKPHSGVAIPSEFNVEEAKEWVEINQK